MIAADLDSALKELENNLGKSLAKQIIILDKENMDCQGPCPNVCSKCFLLKLFPAVFKSVICIVVLIYEI